MAREYKDVVVGLDIGTAKIMAVVAEVLPNGALKLAGLGVAPSNGLKRGVVVNIDATVQSIQLALKEAELMADCKIQRCIPASPAAIFGVLIPAAWWQSRTKRLPPPTWRVWSRPPKPSIFPAISVYCW